MRENRWVIIDLLGKCGRVRAVAIPKWVKQGINAWQTAAEIEGGSLLRSVNKVGDGRDDSHRLAIWAVVTEAAQATGIECSVRP